MAILDRFTPQSSQVLGWAHDEARSFNHPYLGTEHILLGLIRDQESIAGQALAEQGLTYGSIRAAVEFVVGRGEATRREGSLEFTASAGKVLQYALEAAETLDQPSVAPEHLLLGLIRKGEGIAAGVLEIVGCDLKQVWAAVLSKLESRRSTA